MTIGLVFAGITVAAVIMATFSNHIRHSILALWVAGLSVGAVYLTLGAEFLAIIQWIVSTLVTISFVFFAVMFGEFGSLSSQKDSDQDDTVSREIPKLILSIVIGLAFTATIWFGLRDLTENIFVGETAGSDLVVVGQMLTQEHLLSLEVLALTLFLVLVGGGVVARLDGPAMSKSSELKDNKE